MTALVPTARIARVSWWRRLRAWCSWRWQSWRDVDGIEARSQRAGFEHEMKRLAAKAIAEGAYVIDQSGRPKGDIERQMDAAIERRRPEPTSLPGPGERSPR